MKPIVLAMLLADHYYQDAATGKAIISGTFNSLSSPNYPATHGSCALYLSLTDIATKGTVEVLFKEEDGPFSLSLPSWNIPAPDDRRAIIELGGNISGLPIPHEGTYEFVVFWNGKEIFSRRLQAKKISLENRSPLNK